MLASLKLHTSVCQCGATIERYVGIDRPLRALANEENGLQAFADTFIDAPSIFDHAGHRVISLLLPEHRISPLHAGSTEVALAEEDEVEEGTDDEDEDDGRSGSEEVETE